MQNKNSAATRKSPRSLVGSAIHSLRAHVKAHELRVGGDVQFSYKISDDGTSAKILDAAGGTIDERAINVWASEGPSVRLALIGLKAVKERYEQTARKQSSRVETVFALNVLDSRSTLTVDGAMLTRETLSAAVATIGLPDSLSPLVNQLPAGDLTAIASWAKIGREVEIDFFHSLQTAERFELAEATAERERGYRLGIMRRPRTPEDAPAAS